MTTSELERVLSVLERVGPTINPFRDEAIAYVKKDLAIRAQQSKAMYAMNQEQGENDRWPFYGQ